MTDLTRTRPDFQVSSHCFDSWQEIECQIIVEVSLSCSDWKDKEAFLQQCHNKDPFFELQFDNFI